MPCWPASGRRPGRCSSSRTGRPPPRRGGPRGRRRPVPPGTAGGIRTVAAHCSDRTSGRPRSSRCTGGRSDARSRRSGRESGGHDEHNGGDRRRRHEAPCGLFSCRRDHGVGAETRKVPSGPSRPSRARPVTRMDGVPGGRAWGHEPPQSHAPMPGAAQGRRRSVQILGIPGAGGRWPIASCGLHADVMNGDGSEQVRSAVPWRALGCRRKDAVKNASRRTKHSGEDEGTNGRRPDGASRPRDRLTRRARRRRTRMRWGDIAEVFLPVEAQVWQGVGAASTVLFASWTTRATNGSGACGTGCVLRRATRSRRPTRGGCGTNTGAPPHCSPEARLAPRRFARVMATTTPGARPVRRRQPVHWRGRPLGGSG